MLSTYDKEASSFHFSIATECSRGSPTKCRYCGFIVIDSYFKL